jgi:hypothetical protein
VRRIGWILLGAGAGGAVAFWVRRRARAARKAAAQAMTPESWTLAAERLIEQVGVVADEIRDTARQREAVLRAELLS